MGMANSMIRFHGRPWDISRGEKNCRMADVRAKTHYLTFKNTLFIITIRLFPVNFWKVNTVGCDAAKAAALFLQQGCGKQVGFNLLWADSNEIW